MKKLIQYKLKILAKMILGKYRPDVIGITGSVGKTSAKEAIACVLSENKFKVRRNIKNYNNEIGLPLTIIGADSPGSNIFGWLAVFSKALKLILFKDKNYPKILVLEMAADKPGDISYLTAMVKPKVGVLTLIGPVHLEFFGSLEKIIEEKSLIFSNLENNGWAVLNYDDGKARQAVKKMEIKKFLTYGLDEQAKIRAQELNISLANESNNKILGISFKLSYNGSAVPVILPNVLGQPAVYAALAGAAVGIIYGLNLVEISQALKKFKSPLGRMNLINGVKNTLIIDDTYNASPQSTIKALEALVNLPFKSSNQRYAVLGDMLELGSYSETAHYEVGQIVAENKVDKLIVVGERARDIGRGAINAGLNENNIFHFDNSVEAGKFIQDRINPGDIILVKGSQGMRMEKVVLEIMAQPLRVKELLVRQDELWQNK